LWSLFSCFGWLAVGLLLAFRLAVGWLAGWLVVGLALNLFGGQLIFLYVSSIFIE
jgi:hypothetical protein